MFLSLLYYASPLGAYILEQEMAHPLEPWPALGKPFANHSVSQIISANDKKGHRLGPHFSSLNSPTMNSKEEKPLKAVP